MSSKQTYFCWIRLLRLDSLASVQIAPQATVEPFDYYLTGHRPPWAARSLDSAVSDDLDFWFAERNVSKPKSKLVFHSGPAYRRRVSAMAWLQSREGKRWAREAENYMLMNFEREPADAAPSPPPAPPTGKGVVKPKPNPEIGRAHV